MRHLRTSGTLAVLGLLAAALFWGRLQAAETTSYAVVELSISGMT